MNCKDFEKQIPFFQEEALTLKELKEFMAHIDECKECQEELAIHYLINEGILRLEDGDAFDLQQIMDNHMERAMTQLKRRRSVQRFVYGIEGLIVIAIIVILVLILV
jgi:t-SNARE complex subunit (syntaxin)